MTDPSADRGDLLVIDFDDTIVADGGAVISETVADSIRRLTARASVAVVSARATSKAVSAARRALARAGLGDIQLLTRDRDRYDNSPGGLAAAKRAAIAEHAARTGQRAEVGIGDRPSDEVVYRSLGMLVVRLRHSKAAQEGPSGADLEVAVDADGLDVAWADLPERLAAFQARRE